MSKGKEAVVILAIILSFFVMLLVYGNIVAMLAPCAEAMAPQCR